jgi:hypothetical protein
MSYTIYDGKPEGKFIIKDNKLFLSFVCPRCRSTQVVEVDPNDFFYELEIICKDLRCFAPGDGEGRYGYKIILNPEWSEDILGLNDRPLHELVPEWATGKLSR